MKLITFYMIDDYAFSVNIPINYFVVVDQLRILFVYIDMTICEICVFYPSRNQILVYNLRLPLQI